VVSLPGFDAPVAAAFSPAGSVTADAWNAYRDRFVDASGRVFDDANAGITHSESQGYGLLLAFSAGDRATFEQIWRFTRNELLIRDDDLAAWKWDPDAKPHIVDINNASDGDILIAYALGLAGRDWNEPPYTGAARRLAIAIGSSLLVEANGRIVLTPGADGFAPADRPDGAQIVNPSYWIFEAFPMLEQLAPDFPWRELAASGTELIAGARFGEPALPSEWVAITRDGVKPAEGFPPVFGYNAIRIPLYLLRAGAETGPLLAPFERAARSGAPSVIDLNSGKPVEPLRDQGYRMLDAAVACAAGTPIPDDLKRFEPTSYYPSTLYLLAYAYVAESQPQCL
jgi:endoglucanase